jgi:hypothetical protein
MKPWEPDGTWEDAVPGDFAFRLWTPDVVSLDIHPCHDPDWDGEMPLAWAQRYLPRLTGNFSVFPWVRIGPMLFEMSDLALPSGMRNAPGLEEQVRSFLLETGFWSTPEDWANSMRAAQKAKLLPTVWERLKGDPLV